MLTNPQKQRIYSKALLCRRFEERAFVEVKKGNIKIPVYLSAGQEMAPATLAVLYEDLGIKPNVFIQHRGHSTYLCFGGSIISLAHELMSMDDGCGKGKVGSASIHSLTEKIYGHDGLMGSHVPIAVGFAYETKQPTICFVGDAAAEEDYSITSVGWASTKRLPILFVVEDNNLSILTEKHVRRNWSLSDLGKAMQLPHSKNLTDATPDEIAGSFPESIEIPALMNICTHRMFWHAGAGQDNVLDIDPLTELKIALLPDTGNLWFENLEKEVLQKIDLAWDRRHDA